MSRNAFEIRLDTLNLARDILSENHHLEHDLYKESLKHISKKEDGEDVSYAESPDGASPPKGYTVEDVLAKARELYSFVAPSEEKAA